MSRAVEESNRRLLRAGDALDRAYAQPLDVPTLAGIAHVSDSHFIRTFLATFGETPHRYLQRRRVERSMFMLRETDRSVTDICLAVGFTGLGTFSRTFRAIVGEPPTAYRRRADVKAVPTCFDGVDPTEQFQRSGGRRPATSVARMFHTIPLSQISQIYVRRARPSTSTSARSGSRSAPTWTSASCARSPSASRVSPAARSCSRRPARGRWTTRWRSRSANWSRRARRAAGSA